MMDEKSLLESKAELRKEMLKRLKLQSVSDRSAKSESIGRKLLDHPDFTGSRTVMFYLSQSFEVDTIQLFHDSLKRQCVLVPYVDRSEGGLVAVKVKHPEEELVKGSYGILEPRAELVEPFDVHQIDLVLVPGLAFDGKGRRLGRGKGYYDRFLTSLSPQTKRLGLCFDFQLVKQVPSSEHDTCVHEVITN